MRGTNPYLTFPGTTFEAFEFYRSVFGGEFSGAVRFRDLGDGSMSLDEDELDLIAHIALPIGASTLMGTDVTKAYGERFRMGTNTYIHLEADDAAEARRVFDALAAGGAVEMPLEGTRA